MSIGHLLLASVIVLALWTNESSAQEANYDLNTGPLCKNNFEPITSSWRDCKAAAEHLGYSGDAIAHVDYQPGANSWAADRPQGCFVNWYDYIGGNGRFHFNEGVGGNAIGNDQILCKKIEACAENDLNYTGVVKQLLRGYKQLANWQACGKLCERNPNCHVWSFIAYDSVNHIHGQCYIKGVERKPEIGVISGTKHCVSKK